MRICVTSNPLFAKFPFDRNLSILHFTVLKKTTFFLFKLKASPRRNGPQQRRASQLQLYSNPLHWPAAPASDDTGQRSHLPEEADARLSEAPRTHSLDRRQEGPAHAYHRRNRSLAQNHPQRVSVRHQPRRNHACAEEKTAPPESTLDSDHAVRGRAAPERCSHRRHIPCARRPRRGIECFYQACFHEEKSSFRKFFTTCI